MNKANYNDKTLKIVATLGDSLKELMKTSLEELQDQKKQLPEKDRLIIVEAEKLLKQAASTGDITEINKAYKTILERASKIKRD